ncbi:JAB domain-containing protein [Oceanivirga miroungae]|uniref:DNA repair protein RadC n=1 Tax=Oceanivirga miroungae TaxID=1130046 RepID=A0A6I8M7J8_9FUSO|nr:JAB domain-containing protein [Oceanivirga miroungae]VWL84790.1 DNA repair protein RadC [Oceanivirga miroungae]
MNILENYENLDFQNLDEKDILKLLIYISGYKNVDKKLKELLEYYDNYENIFKLKINLNKKVNKRFIYLLKLLNDVSYNYIHDKIKIEKNILNESRLVAEFFRRKIGTNASEEFNILLLNNSYQYLNSFVLAKGSIDRTHIYIRDVIYPILECNAKYVIICHNHPSGNLNPSEEDEYVTRRVSKLLKSIDVSLIDHIIVTKDNYYSFAERRKI